MHQRQAVQKSNVNVDRSQPITATLKWKDVCISCQPSRPHKTLLFPHCSFFGTDERYLDNGLARIGFFTMSVPLPLNTQSEISLWIEVAGAKNQSLTKFPDVYSPTEWQDTCDQSSRPYSSMEAVNAEQKLHASSSWAASLVVSIITNTCRQNNTGKSMLHSGEVNE